MGKQDRHEIEERKYLDNRPKIQSPPNVGTVGRAYPLQESKR